MAYRVAGIDIHKRMLAVVIADVSVEGPFRFERRLIGTTLDHLQTLVAWLLDREVDEVVMESTAQSWRPVWDVLERDWQPVRRSRVEARPTAGALHLAQAQSNAGGVDERKTFPTPNGWSSAWSPTNSRSVLCPTSRNGSGEP